MTINSNVMIFYYPPHEIGCRELATCVKIPCNNYKKLFRTMAKIYKINLDVLIKFYIA